MPFRTEKWSKSQVRALEELLVTGGRVRNAYDFPSSEEEKRLSLEFIYVDARNLFLELFDPDGPASRTYTRCTLSSDGVRIETSPLVVGGGF